MGMVKNMLMDCEHEAYLQICKKRGIDPEKGFKEKEGSEKFWKEVENLGKKIFEAKVDWLKKTGDL